MTSPVRCQTDQQSLTITVKDKVSGGLAEGVTIVIQDSDGDVVRTIQATGKELIQTTLPNGEYKVLVQISLFGVPSTLGSKTFNITQPTNLEIEISAVLVPVQYFAWTVYSITGAVGATTAVFSVRYVLKLRKIAALIKAAQSALIGVGGAIVVPVGVKVAVQPDPKVLLSFSKVTKTGTATAKPVSMYPPLPKGGSFLGSAWDIETAAAFAGMVVVGICFDGSGMTLEQKKKLKVYRIDLGQKARWKDVTARVDSEKNIAYGTTDHFSIFGVR